MFILKTPNNQYNGVTEGVPFSKGVGQTDNANIRNILVNDYGYEDVTPEVTEKSIDDMTVPELKKKAEELNLKGFSNLKRDKIIALILGEDKNKKEEPPTDEGETDTEEDPENND